MLHFKNGLSKNKESDHEHPWSDGLDKMALLRSPEALWASCWVDESEMLLLLLDHCRALVKLMILLCPMEWEGLCVERISRCVQGHTGERRHGAENSVRAEKIRITLHSHQEG